MHQNTGGTIEKRDTTHKIICNCCGKNFYICYSKKIDAFIDDLSKNYYKNIRLSNKAKLYKLQSQLKTLKSKSVIDINNECEAIRAENIQYEQQLSKLIDNFLDCSEIMKRIIDKKISSLELLIQDNNNRNLELERIKANIDGDKVDIERKIRELKKELTKLDTVEITRDQLMDKISCIKVDKGNKFIVEYL